MSSTNSAEATMSSRPGKEKDLDQPQKQRRRPGRVPVSCAECRRLKLRCDRKVPCDTCAKRGCASICPNGTMASGKINNRYVLANTEELHVKIKGLSTRAHALEEALQALQSTLDPNVQHPLLKPELMLPTSSSPGPVQSSPAVHAEVDYGEDIVDAFGTMSIGPKGDAKFFGATARSEFLIRADRGSSRDSFTAVTRLDERLFNVAFPEAENDECDDELRRLVWSYLPPLSDACELGNLYLENSQLLYGSVNRTQLFDEVITSVYKPGAVDTVGSAHALSLFFIICALGAICDLSRPNFRVEAHEYFILSKAAMTIESPIRTTTVLAVQTMCFMAQYLDLNESTLLPSASSKAWLYIGIAVKLAHSMGLHLNGARWHLDESERQRRARVFWHLFMVDTWFSFGSGRPPSVNLAFVGCELPAEDSEYMTADGKKEISFLRWHHLYAKLLYKIMVGVVGAKTPRYLDVIDFDRQVQEILIPEYLRLDMANAHPDSTSLLTCQRWVVYSYKEWTLLNIHRAYFAVALRDKPTDLVKHKYGPSVIATCRAAYRMVEGAEIALQYVHGVFFRSNFACSRVLSAAIVMCLLVCSAPSSDLASASLQVLNRASIFFEQAADRGSFLAAENLEFVRNLRSQATEAMDNTEHHSESSLTAAELERLGGMTQLISQKPSYSSENAPPNASHAGQNDNAAIHPVFTQATYWQDLQFHNTVPAVQRGTPYPPQHPHTSTAQASRPQFSMPESRQSVRYPGLPFDEEAFSQPSIFTSSHEPMTVDVQAPAPYVLDATWQDFLEQLGF